MIPRSIVTVNEQLRPLDREHCFERAESELSEEAWDEIICANSEALADALREAELIGGDSTLRVLGKQVDKVDVLLAEVPFRGHGDDSAVPPRRLVLLEDKLIKNPEAKRQVLAQLLDYAQRAQREWSAKQLATNPELEKHSHWLKRHAARIDELLAEGDLLLIIAGDEIHQDLLRLARRFATHTDQISLSELCLVSMAVFRRKADGATLLIPHVVSAVERHQRRLAIRVTVQDHEGKSLPARTLTEVEDDEVVASRVPPRNADAEAFLRRAIERIAASGQLASGYVPTKAPRKKLSYWFERPDGEVGAAELKIHFGSWDPSEWTPILVALDVEKTADSTFRRLASKLQSEGALPADVTVKFGNGNAVTVGREFNWKEASELGDALLEEVTRTLLALEKLFRKATTI